MFMPFKILNQQKVNVLGSLIHTAYVDCFLFSDVSVGSDSDLNENEKDPYQQSVQGNEIDICEKILKDNANILMNFLMYQSLNFQLTHHILISIPIPSTNLFF